MSKVLFVDDDPVVIDIYRRKLQQAGFTVETATDGVAALGRLKSINPDVVVLDIMMPKFSGLDVLKYLRGQPGFQTLPVIVMSNMFFGSEQREAAGAGANRVLPKAGCTPAALIAAIREVLGQPPSGETPGETPPAAPGGSPAQS